MFEKLLKQIKIFEVQNMMMDLVNFQFDVVLKQVNFY